MLWIFMMEYAETKVSIFAMDSYFEYVPQGVSFFEVILLHILSVEFWAVMMRRTSAFFLCFPVLGQNMVLWCFLLSSPSFIP